MISSIDLLRWARDAPKVCGVSSRAGHVLLVLASYCSPRQLDVFPSLATIASDCLLERETEALRRALKELDNAGLTSSVPGGGKDSTVRTLNYYPPPFSGSYLPPDRGTKEPTTNDPQTDHSPRSHRATPKWGEVGLTVIQGGAPTSDALDDLGPERPLPDPLADARRAEPCRCRPPEIYRDEDGDIQCHSCGRSVWRRSA